MADGHDQTHATIERLLLRCTAQGMFAIDLDGVCTYANDAAGQLLGMHPESMVGEPLHPLIHHHRSTGPRLPISECAIDRAMRREETVRTARDTFFTSDDQQLPVQYTVSPLRANGELLGAVVAFQETASGDDDTGELETAFLKGIVETIPDAVLVISPERHVLHYNQHFVDMWKVPPDVLDRSDDEELLQAASRQLVDRQGFVRRVHEAYEHRERDVRERIAFRDGRVIDRYGGPIFDDAGGYAGYLWFFHDITRDVKESARREREAVQERATAVARTQQAETAGDEYRRALQEYQKLVRHRMANPLTTILAGIETLRHVELDRETREHLLEVMEADGRRLHRVTLDPRAMSSEEELLEPTLDLETVRPETLERARNKEQSIAQLNQQMLDQLEGMISEDSEIDFLCECSALTCVEPVRMSVRQYREIHADGKHFVIAPGHLVANIDEIVEEHQGWWIVRKREGVDEGDGAASA